MRAPLVNSQPHKATGDGEMIDHGHFYYGWLLLIDFVSVASSVLRIS